MNYTELYHCHYSRILNFPSPQKYLSHPFEVTFPTPSHDGTTVYNTINYVLNVIWG